MSGHDQGSDSERIEMLEEHQHREGGLTNGTKTAFEEGEALQFVRLFIEKEFTLTYGFLEKLYRTVDKDTHVTHFYKLLLKLLKERLGTSYSVEEISLFEVSVVLKKFMGEEKPFYFTALGLKDFTSGKEALKDAKELLNGDCSYRNNACESPWTHLFIWAVLLNHSDMAVFLWEKAEEPVMNALGAFKMLKELSKLETQTETRLSMEKLAQKFGDRAHGMLDCCYQSDESLSSELLYRKSPVWDTDCFQMGIAAESHSFFRHDGLESTLSQAWSGDMEKDTTWWKVLLNIGLFCLPLSFNKLITFREPKTAFLSRWRQFWSAPITSFVGNALWYFPFLFLFAYVLLVDFNYPYEYDYKYTWIGPNRLSISEYVLYFWVFTFLCEEIYEACFMHNMTSRQRLKLYIQDFWNKYDLTAIILFIIGVICRHFEWSYRFGRCVLCIDYMVFALRLIHIFAVHKQMGPKIIIVGKMMNDVFSFILLLGVWIVAYGVANQALQYDYDANPYRIFREVFYIPFLHIFGEEIEALKFDYWGYDDIVQHCTVNMTWIDGGATPCRNSYWLSVWLTIILLVVFLLATVILLLNLLIAMLTNTFDNVQKQSDIYWKFQHYNLIVEFQSKPGLPPPLIIINHLYLIFTSLCWKPSCTTTRDKTVDPPVEEREEKKVGEVNWEMKQMEKFREMERFKMEQPQNLKRLTEQLNETKASLTELNEQLTEMRAFETKMENTLGQILDLLTKHPPGQRST